MTERGQVSGGWGIESTAYDPPLYFYTNPTDFVAEKGSAVGEIDLSWVNPALPDFDHVVVRRKEGGYPSGPTDGDLVYSGAGVVHTDGGRTPGTTYFYALYAFDTWGIPSSGAFSSSEPLPPDYTAPPGVADFLATPGPANIQLTWDNPVDPDFAGVVIRRKEGSYPTSYLDGVLVYDGAGESVIDSGLDHTKTYYYCAYAYDAPIQGPPPNYSTPAQTNESPNQTDPTEVRILEKGLLEALIEVIGEQDTEIGGHRITRLTAVANQGDTSASVEVTEGWPESGKIGIDGVKYTYEGKTFTSFTGLKHVATGVEVVGCAIQHRIESPVVDTSRGWSAIEQLRKALIVEYANGDNLNVIGRNLGVNRLPLFRTDDQFREVIKVMAYNPKGTVFGLDLALSGIVGAGNFKIIEDMLKYPNTVFIRLLGSVVTEDISAGKSFLQSLVYDDLGGAHDELELPTGSVPITIQGVVFPGLDKLFNLRAQLPSDILYDYYPGAPSPGSAFTYTGSEPEGVVMSNPGDEYLQFLTSISGGSALYEMTGPKGARIVPETKAAVTMLVRFPIGHELTLGDPKQFHIHVHDGQKVIGIGTVTTISPTPIVGLYKPGDTSFQGATVTLFQDRFYELILWKRGEDWVELYVDGQLISRVAYSVFNANSDHKVEFGVEPISGTRKIHVKHIGMDFHTPKDYWSDENTGGEGFDSPNETKFDSGITNYFQVPDIGKRLDIWGSSAVNPFGGNNNGSWLIDSIVPGTTSDAVLLAGETHTGAEVESANPTRITVDAQDAFTFPDDLGKKITLSGSALGNDGTYVITKLLKEGTFEDLAADFDTELSQKTTVCECAAAALTSETSLEWNLTPNMVAETSLNWRLSDAGVLSGLALTLRDSLWVNGLIMGIRFTDVLSSQVLENTSVVNTLIQDDPTVLYEFYPFYVNDPMGLIQAYLTTITAAGVIPEFELV